jgi:hypothetical protein
MVALSSYNRFNLLLSKGNPIKIDQHPFPTNTVEVSSKGSSHVKLLLTSKLAQNKRAVDPNVQATTADVKGKRVAT